MKKFMRIFWIAVFAILVIGTFYFLWSKSNKATVRYQIVESSMGDISRSTVATGEINPRDKVEVKPQVSGLIKTLYVEAGDTVKKDDILALVQVIPEMNQLSSAQSSVKLAQIELEQQELEFKRTETLFQKKIIAQEEYDQSKVTYLKAKENLANAEDGLEIIKTGMAKRSSSYSNTKIKATISGMVLDVPIKVGNSVILANTFNDGTTIATLANMKDIIFEGTIDETEVGSLHPGMAMVLSVGALPDMKFPATLEYISPMGTASSGAVVFTIKAAAKIPEGVTIRAGYSANATIILEEVKNVLTVPESCVEMTNDSSFVYVFKEEKGKDQIFTRQPVTLGLSDGLNIEIKSGLDVADKLRGNEQIVNHKK